MPTIRSSIGDLTVAGMRRLASHPQVARRLFREVLSADTNRVFGGPDSPSELLDFLAFAHVNRSRGNGQLLQDLWVLYETQSREGGYFVEFGAADGISHSNTLSLERAYGWQGLLAEPNPDQSSLLHANRTATIDCRCVWRSTGEVLDLLVTADPEFSTIIAEAVPDLHTSSRLQTGKAVSAETVSLNDLLSQNGSPRVIDYMSVDTEGTELEIMRHFDFSAHEVQLLSIEHNHRPESVTPLDQLMDSKGYDRRFRGFSDFDAWYRKRTTGADRPSSD